MIEFIHKYGFQRSMVNSLKWFNFDKNVCISFSKDSINGVPVQFKYSTISGEVFDDFTTFPYITDEELFVDHLRMMYKEAEALLTNKPIYEIEGVINRIGTINQHSEKLSERIVIIDTTDQYPKPTIWTLINQ